MSVLEAGSSDASAEEQLIIYTDEAKVMVIELTPLFSLWFIGELNLSKELDI